MPWQRKSRRRHRRRRRVGLGLCGGARPGRQEGRALGAGAGLADVRSHQLRHLGAAGEDRPALRSCSKARTPSATAISRAGAWAARRCTTSPISRASSRTTSRSRASTIAPHDWPISYDDVAPYYDQVAQDIGVSGDAKAEEPWRPAGKPYPMPPMKTFRHGEIWLKGFESVGIRMVPAAVGMNSTEFKGRPACIYDGWCHVGCPIGALANPNLTYLADAKKAGAGHSSHRARSRASSPMRRAARSRASSTTTRRRNARCRRRAWSCSPLGPRRTRG